MDENLLKIYMGSEKNERKLLGGECSGIMPNLETFE